MIETIYKTTYKKYEQRQEINELDNAITEAEYKTEEKLLDARESLLSLRKKRFK